MKVKELIEKLQTYDRDMIVSVDGYEGGVTDYITIKVKKVELNFNKETYYGEHEEDDISDKDADGVRLVIGRGARPNAVWNR